MNQINSKNVVTILVRALNSIDSRLVDHGYRVSYIVYKMMKQDGTYCKKDIQELAILAMLHDIGAYKTEEIDNMVGFESEDVWEHSIYGYLFMKHMTPLYKWSEVLLYHHLDFNKHSKIKSDKMQLADMMHLADRIDIMLQGSKKFIDIDLIREYKDKKFSAKTIELFITTNGKFNLEQHLKDGTYMEELMQVLTGLDYDEATLLEYIKMIAYAIDFRSETTVSHVITTVSISVELGKLLGLNKDELKKILLGAYLHDIGKIATPLEILEKPGRLTKEEFLIMKDHINMTREILEDRISKEILQIAYRHHEKMDGSGYPQNLTGDQLTESERIVVVADIMSALTGKRSYKESFDKEMVIEILLRQRDEGKICYDVTEAAVSNYDNIMENTEANCKEIIDIYKNIRFEFNRILKKAGGEI